MSGFIKDKTPKQMVEMFKEHLGQWDTEKLGRPTFQAMAQFLNSREAFTSRGLPWSGQTLFVAAQRYHVHVQEFIPEPLNSWKIDTHEVMLEESRERIQINQEIIRSQMLDWAHRYTLKLVPSAGLVARDLNLAESRTLSGRCWQHATVTNMLSTLGYGGQVAILLEASGWVAGIGRTQNDLEEYERERRFETMRPQYEMIVAEGFDLSQHLNFQVSLVARFDGITNEEAVIKYSRVPSDTLEALALLGEETLAIGKE